MEIWLDAQLSPGLAKWITHQFKLVCHPNSHLRSIFATQLPIALHFLQSGDELVEIT